MDNQINILISGYGNLGYHIHKTLADCPRLNVKIHSASRNKIIQKNFTPDAIWVLKNDENIREEIVRLKKIFPCALFISSSAVFNIHEIQNVPMMTLYPLGTFVKRNSNIIMHKVPFFLEYGKGVSEHHKKISKQIFKAIRIKPVVLSYEERIKLHLAAVFVNNFTNALLHVAINIAGKKSKYLLPILQQTIENMKKMNPVKTQTGPAVRGDKNTIQKHLDFLSNWPELKKMYLIHTKYIQENIRKNGI